MKRRDFLKSIAAGIAALALPVKAVAENRGNSGDEAIPSVSGAYNERGVYQVYSGPLSDVLFRGDAQHADILGVGECYQDSAGHWYIAGWHMDVSGCHISGPSSSDIETFFGWPCKELRIISDAYHGRSKDTLLTRKDGTFSVCLHLDNRPLWRDA